MKPSAKNSNGSYPGNNIVVILIGILIFVSLLGGLVYYVSVANREVSPEDENEIGVNLPEEAVICGSIAVEDGNSPVLLAADGNTWELSSTSNVSLEQLEAFNEESICVLAHPNEFAADYRNGILHVDALLQDVSGTENESEPEEDTDEEDEAIEDPVNDQTAIVCGIIDLAGTEIILEDENGETWELFPQDGASSNMLEGREGVQTCIDYGDFLEDQTSLEDHQIMVVSAAMIRDAGEEEL